VAKLNRGCGNNLAPRPEVAGYHLMSDNICFIVQLAIQPGKLEDFKSVARELISTTQTDPNTLDYEWYLSADQTICHIFERYRDSDAVMFHLKTFQSLAPNLLESCQITNFAIYGRPNAAVKAALADVKPAYFAPLGGFSR
jgi:quinol monooxygenase YgiN